MSKPEAGRHGRWRPALSLALLAAGLGACAPQFYQQPTAQGCVRPRLEAAAQLFDESKQQLAQFFKQRFEGQLLNALHASNDAMRIARSTQRCFDFDDTAKEQALQLILSARLLNILVFTNLRDDDPGVMVGLYRERYREIIKNDIQ
ncbi:MAG: hypothetical protein HY423_03550 [Candidatus Lambdaproteobacteria bacterium]|nr:hypothetical protein [Candidatus Lambdaproteobacteria bacterium]